MDTYDYQQKSGQGCLAVCLAYLYGMQPNRDFERFMMAEGHLRHRDSFALGMVEAFLAYKGDSLASIVLCVGNRTYGRYLQQLNHGKHLIIQHLNFQAFLETPRTHEFVLCIDSFVLGSYVHGPHYILVLDHTPKTFKIYDPWMGNITSLSKKKVVQGIRLLEKHLGYSSMAISTAKITVLNHK